MSRSYKKTPIIKDNGRSKKWSKRQANKVVRKSNDIANYMQYKKAYDSWDVCDWKDYYPINSFIQKWGESFHSPFVIYRGIGMMTLNSVINKWKKRYYWK